MIPGDVNENEVYEKFACAANKNDLPTVLEMLSNGSIVHVDGLGTRCWGRKSALYEACCAGHLSVVQALIQAGADVNLSFWPADVTALHVACDCYDNDGIIEALLDAGANVNARTRSGETALFLIVQSKVINSEDKLDFVRLLLNANCDVNVMVGRSSALLLACENNNTSSELLRLLIEYGADLTTRNYKGMTALHLLIENKFPSEDIEMLLENGIDVNAKMERRRCTWLPNWRTMKYSEI